MSAFTDKYISLLIKQYWEKPRAKAEIGAMVGTWETVRDGLAAFVNALDLDQAVGAQLDIIGKIVGMPRVIPFVIPKIVFGFSENPNSGGFGDKFVTVENAAPFLDKFEATRSPLELNDIDYRFFIKARIAANIASAYMVSDVKTALQDVINTQFEGLAYAVDRQDMTLALYVSPAVDPIRLQAIQQLDLLPRPQGVRYDVVIQSVIGGTFGFADNLNSKGFADKFDSGVIGGRFAYKIVGDVIPPAVRTWVQIGSGLAVAGVGVPALAALDSTDVAFIDGDNDELRTYRWDGSNWSQTGSGLAVAGAGFPALTALNSTDVAFIDGDNDELRTYRWDGSNWSQIGSGLAIPSVGFSASLAALNSTDVAFMDSTNDELRTYRWDGSNWSQIGSGLALALIGFSALTALSGTDVAFTADGIDELRTYRWDGSNWSQIGSGLAIAGMGLPGLAALNSTDVVFIDRDNDELRTYRWDGSNWSQIGSGSTIPNVFALGITALNSTDVAFIDSANDELRAYRWTY